MPEREPIGPQAILAKRQQYLIPCSYHFYRDPPQIVRGQGIYVYDSAGRRYMDLYSGVSVHALGHCHPEIVEAICQQVRTLQHTSTIYLTEPPDPHHGRLSCTDCHDPAKPRQHQEEFAAKCATCHNSRYRALFYSWVNALDHVTK